jgi:hypothetical protein
MTPPSVPKILTTNNRQVRDCSAQTLVLLPQAFEFLQLVGSHPAILLTLPATGPFCYAKLADLIRTRHSLADKHINNLARLPDKLFGLVPSVCNPLSSVA